MLKDQQNISEPIRDFYQNIQKCELDLQSFINFGYVLYGQTKSGNTSIAHLMSRSTLRGVKIRGQQKVEVVHSISNNAKIGNTQNTETRIPNIFKVQQANNLSETVYIIDLPGYNNPHGILKILTSAYSHYKICSRVQNMKFILCFDESQLRNTSELFIDTIVQFTSQFRNYECEKEKIWKSCVFIFNKVHESEFTLEDIKQKLRDISQLINLPKNKSQIDLIKEFISYIVKNNKLLIIKKYKNGESITELDLLSKIDKLSSWWITNINNSHNDIVNADEVDMIFIQPNIVNSILVQVAKNQQSKYQIISLIILTSQRIDQLLYNNTLSFYNVINELVKDLIKSPKSCNFLNLIQNYLHKYYPLYAENYEEKRIKLMKSFSHCWMMQKTKEKRKYYLQNSDQSQSKKANLDVIYLLKKFTAFKEIDQIQQQSIIFQSTSDYRSKSINHRLNYQISVLHNMMKSLFKICRNQNQRELISKYWYLTQQFIKEAKFLFLVLEYHQSSSCEKIQDALGGKFFPLLMRMLMRMEDNMRMSYLYSQLERQISFKEIYYVYLKKLDLDNEGFSQTYLNQIFVQFVSQNLQNCSYYDDENLCMQKNILLILKYSDKFIQTNLPKINGDLSVAESTKLIYKLVKSRINSQQFLQLEQHKKEKNKWLFILRGLTKNIAILLIHIKQYKLAREIYNSILFIDSICHIYEQQLSQQTKTEKKEVNKSDEFNLLLEYSKYINDNSRTKPNIVLLQRAFEIAQNLQQLQQTANMISEQIGSSISNNSTFFQKLFEQKFYDNFSEELQGKLESL